MENIDSYTDSSCKKPQNTYDLSEDQSTFIEGAEDETQKGFQAFLKKLNEIPNKKKNKKGIDARAGAINAYNTFFKEYSKLKTEGTLNGKTIGELLTTLKDQLERLPQGEPILQITGVIAGGKSHVSEDIITIIHECGGTIFPGEKEDQSQVSQETISNISQEVKKETFDPKKYLVENDITEHFDKVILTQLGENRGGDFFSQYLRDIGYLTMGLFNGVHVAPFKKGTDSRAYKAYKNKPNQGEKDQTDNTGDNNKIKCPLLLITLHEKNRTKNYVRRNAGRDTGRLYMVELPNKEVMKASEDPESSSIYRIRNNNNNFNETLFDISKFIISNKEHFQITMNNRDIFNIIKKVLKKKKEYICEEKAKEQILETLREKNPLFSTRNIDDLFSKKYKEETDLRNTSYLQYTTNILKKYEIDPKTQGSILKSIHEELLHQQERDSFAYFTFDNNNEYSNIIKKHLENNSNFQNILKDLQNKCPKIKEDSRRYYVMEITRRELMKLREDGEKAELINEFYFDYTCDILEKYKIDQKIQYTIGGKIINTLEIQQKENPFAYFTFENYNAYYNIIKNTLKGNDKLQQILGELQNKCPKIDESLTYDECLRKFMVF